MDTQQHQQQQNEQRFNRTSTRSTRSLLVRKEEAEKLVKDSYLSERTIDIGCRNEVEEQPPSAPDTAGPAQLGSVKEEVIDSEVFNYNHQCYICDKIFSANSNLNRHLRRIHKENVQSPYNNVKCALCDCACPSSAMYITHLEDDHEVKIEIENRTFPDRQTFDEWKYGVEDATMSQFIKSRGEKRTKDINKTYFSCNRSGYYVSKARTQKALKKQGSRKINGRCPASMNVTMKPDLSYEVRFIKTHVGHDFSLKHLDLSEKDRDLIVQKLSEGVTKKDIIKHIRSATELHHPSSRTMSPASSVSGVQVASVSSITSLQHIVISGRNSLATMSGDSSPCETLAATSKEEISTLDYSANASSATTPIPNNSDSNITIQNNLAPTTRLHLATTKDIHNILNSKHLDSKKIRHNYDFSQLEAWIHEMDILAEDCGVLIYKNQGDQCEKFPKLQEDDFVMVLMKPGQEQVLKEHGHRCIVLQSTHNVHCEHLHVAYLAVVDQNQKGFPVAFMFSTRTDSDMMEVFFTLLKDRVGPITTKMFIADEQHEFYQAWWRVMSMPLHNLLTPWTVFDSWSKRFSLIRSREKLRKLKKQLKLLLNETEQDRFSRSLNQISSDYRTDPDVMKFFDYFDDNHGKNPEVWSACLRKTYGVSNYQLWCMHEKFKAVYKEGKNSKKMSKFVTALMNLFDENQLQTLQTLESCDRGAKVKGLEARHRRGLDTVPSIYEIAVEPLYWLCPSEGTSGNVYEEVRRRESDNAEGDHRNQQVQNGQTNIEPENESKRQQRSTRRDSGKLAADGVKHAGDQTTAKGPRTKNRKCCDLKCSTCGCCRHDYGCTCLDYVFNMNMCKHIHRISNMFKTYT